MELGGSLPHSQQSTTCQYPSQINPFLCPSHFWQSQLVSFLVGLRTYQHPGINTPTFLEPSHPSYLPAYEDGTDRVFRNVDIWNSDPREHPEERMQHSEHGEGLKSRMFLTCFIHSLIDSFIHSWVFSLRGRAGRNQSPVMWPVWLWHTASWASSWGVVCHCFPPPLDVPTFAARCPAAKGGTVGEKVSGNFA